MFKTIISKIRNADFLSQEVGVTVRSESVIKNICGGCLSILTVILFGTITIYFGLEIVTKNEPIVRSYEATELSSRVYIKNFPIVFYAYLPGRNDLLMTYADSLELMAESVTFPATGSTTKGIYEPLILERCQQNFMGESHWDYVSKTFDLGKVLCLNPFMKYNVEKQLVLEDIYFENPYASPGSTFIRIIMKKCNENLKHGCLEKLSKINIFFGSLAFPDTYNDLASSEDPVKTNWVSLVQQMSMQLYSRNYFGIKLAELITDNGIIFKDESSKDFVQFNGEKSVLNIYSETDRQVLDFTLHSSNLKNVFYRKYIKIPELFASIGGFIKAIVTITKLFIYDYSNYILYKKLEKKSSISKSKQPARNVKIEFRIDRNKVPAESIQSRHEFRASNLEEPTFTDVSYWKWFKGGLLCCYCKKRNYDLDNFKNIFDLESIHDKRVLLEARIEALELKENK